MGASLLLLLFSPVLRAALLRQPSCPLQGITQKISDLPVYTPHVIGCPPLYGIPDVRIGAERILLVAYT